MEIAALLRTIDAPPELIEWVETTRDFDEAWAACERGDHRLWLAAASGVPIELVVEAAAAAALTAIDTLAEVHDAISNAIEIAVSGGSIETLREVAEICEHLAEGDLAGYRNAASPGHRAAATAAGLVARAAEGHAVGEAIRESARLERSRSVAALVGIATSAALSAPDDVARLSMRESIGDPAQDSFLFAVAAAAEAVCESVIAVSLGTPSPAETTKTAERQLGAIVKDTLEAALG